MTIITSLQNPKVKSVVSLRERRGRKQAGLILVEGYDELAVALASGARAGECYYCPALFRSSEQLTMIEALQHQGTTCYEVSDRVFEKMAYRENPDGWLATFGLVSRSLGDLPLRVNPLVVVGEGIEKPGNLGAILRVADAAGADAVIASNPLTDWGNPNIVRASKGTLFTVPVSEASNAETIEWLRRNHIQIVATSPQAETACYEADLSGAVAIIAGTERDGLTDEWLHQADITVRIPMFGAVNSLNVAAATTILIYEAVRQRR